MGAKESRRSGLTAPWHPNAGSRRSLADFVLHLVWPLSVLDLDKSRHKDREQVLVDRITQCTAGGTMNRMLNLKYTVVFCACLASAMLGFPVAHAGPYDAEYVFGDSLSDNGNAAEFQGAAYPYPPSYHDAYTNGPVAVALLAKSLGLPALEPSLWANGFMDVHNIFPPGFVPGTNYAFAGATASEDGTIVPGANLPDQVMAYTTLVSKVADPSALYVVMIGGNDVILTALAGLSQPAADAVLMGSVKSEVDQIKTLVKDGAKSFLVVNVPDVGLIPFMTEEHSADAAAATADSKFYDSQLNMQLASLGLPATALREFDLYDFNTTILNNATDLGFTNTTQPCFSDAPFFADSMTNCSIATVNNFIFWNDVHPSGHVQALWATGMEAAIPEPSTWAMLLLGFAGTGFAGLRSARKASAA
jgi:phospholipase/lecithinase/hemolysin